MQGKPEGGVEGWLTDDGRTAEGALRARRLFEQHMPELVPLLDRLAEQVDRPAAGTLLTMAALKPFLLRLHPNRRQRQATAQLRLPPGRMRGHHRPLPLPAPDHRHAGRRLGAA